MLRTIFLLVGLLFFAVFFSGKSEATSDTKLQVLLNHIDEIRIENNVPAVGLVIVKEGETEWMGSFGVVNLQDNILADENTFYRVGSITKAFTSLSLLKLQEQKKLNLTDPLKQYVSTDYFQNPWGNESPISIEQLLEHTAGFTDIGTAEFGHEDPKPISLLDGLAFNGENHLVQWKPGMHSSYSNLGTGFAGAVIENASGSSFDDYLSNEILVPLNMNHSSTLLTPYLKHNLATGYDSSGEEAVDYWHILLRPFGALNSSPKEMGNFIKLLVNRGKVNGKHFLSEPSIKRMESPQTTLAAKSGLSFGYGFGIYSSEHKGFSFHGHGGTAAGYLARYDYLLENKSGYAVMINSNNSSALSEIYTAIKDYLVSDLDLVNVDTNNGRDKSLKKDVSDYLGFYQPATSRSRVAKFLSRFLGIKKLTRDNESLILSSLFRESTVLFHQGSHFYRQQNYKLADLALLKTKSGDIYLQNESNYQKITNASFYTQVSIMLLTIGLMLFGLLYFLWLFIKLLYLRSWPNRKECLSLLRFLPFVLFACLFILLIFFSTNKDTIAASLFIISGFSIILASMVSLAFAINDYFNRKHKLVTRISHIFVALVSVILGLYLYHWDLISQPIWS